MDQSPTQLLELEHVTKDFGAVRVLRGISFEVGRGEIVGLMGGNGAGKSTLVNIIAGRLAPTSGTVNLRGQPMTKLGTADRQSAGIAVIYQELMLVPELSVAENIALGRLPRTVLGQVDWRAMYEQAERALARMGVTIDPRQRVGSLSTGVQQQVEICRALTTEPALLIMDEPTSALSETETQALFMLVDRLRRDGTGIIYISHHMSEVLRLTDRLVVMRDGNVVGSGPTATFSSSQIADLLVGETRRAEPATQPRSSVGAPLLEVDRLSAPGVQRASLTVGEGEIIGIAGAMGSGRTELLQALYGLTKSTAGSAKVLGEPIGSEPATNVARRIFLAPESRKEDGLLLHMNIAENVTMPRVSRFAKWGLVSRRRQNETTRTLMTEHDVKAESPRQQVAQLSGGNQQKAILARWLSMQPRLLMLDQPTRGLDVNAKAQVYAAMRALASTGAGVLFVATELGELPSVADRVYVMRAGEIVDHIATPSTLSESDLVMLTSAEQASAA